MVDAELIDEAAEVLRRGGLVAFPTETVYGLGADATNVAAVERVFRVKGRPPGHPLIVHLPAGADLDRWALEVPPAAEALVAAFWPGPLTLLLRRSSLVPDVVTGGRETVGLRVPGHPVAMALLERFGRGVAAPSANRFGHVSPTRADHVRADLGDAVDLVIDGSPCEIGVESTIVDLSHGEVEVVRPGRISPDELGRVTGVEVGTWQGQRAVAAPGTLPSHYAPQARLELVASEDDAAEAAANASAAGEQVGVLAPGTVTGAPHGVVDLGPAGDPDDYARVLYERLRQADRLGLDVVVVVPPPERGIGAAVRDRLRRAAAG